MCIGLLLLAVVAVCGLAMGAVQIPVQDVIRTFFSFGNDQPPAGHSVIMDIRLPRVAGAIAIGALLSLAGVILQSLLRNHLADGSVVGTSSGAMLFTAAFIVLPVKIPMTQMAQWISQAFVSFAGAMTITWLILRLNSGRKKMTGSGLVLTGIAIGALASAVTGFFIFISSESQLRTLTFWSLGSLGGLNHSIVILLWIILALVLYIVLKYAHDLNRMALGDDEARLLGIDTQRLKKILMITASVAIGVSVSFTGIIGFIGLVVPHLARLLTGFNHTKVILLSAVIGALLLLLSDTVARTIVLPSELPIGIVTSLIGVPFFISLILKSRRTI